MSGSRGSYAIISGVILLAIIGIAVFGAHWLAPYDPVAQQAAQRLQAPDAQHWLGTDRFGRDLLSRALYGGQTTLLAVTAALATTVALGLTLGMIAGMYHRTWLDAVIMRIVDVLLAFPFMVVAMVVAALFGSGLFHLLAAIVAVSWVSFARLTRSIVLQAKSEVGYAAARVLGASNARIMYREWLPRLLGPVMILAAFEVGNLILSVAALSFLGLGLGPPSPEWGSMLADGRDHFFQHPHLLLAPSLFIVAAVAAFNLLGEGLRDRLDPHGQQQIDA